MIETTTYRATPARSPAWCRFLAAVAPVVGADMVTEVLGRIASAVSVQPAQVNGYPALILRLNGEINTVIAVRIDDGLITGLYAVRNPEKLSHLDRETALRR